MEITRQQAQGFLELKIEGRLDAFWSEHLNNELSDVVREGAHHIRLDLAGVTYLSSAGIRAMLKFYKQLKGIQGWLVVSNPSNAVKTVLALAGLEALLISGPTPASAETAEPSRVQQLERESAKFEIWENASDASLTCSVIGNPEPLLGCRFAEQHCHTRRFPDSTFAVGLGAFGNDFNDCRRRFGEFLAVAGTAAYLPTDGTNVPDYIVTAGTLVPELQVLYGLACEGQFAHVAHFEARQGVGAVTLSELVDTSLEIAGKDIIGMVMVAESAGLVGAALRRSPTVHGSAAAPFEHPEVRQWLSLTTERAYAHCLTVVVGVATRTDQGSLGSMLRPLTDEPSPTGHFHAAAFPYRPLKKGEIDLKVPVVTLFEAETLHEILHLLCDGREISGAGQSEFVRGTCWIGPIAEVVTDKEVV